MRLISKITLAIVLLAVVALVSYLQTSLRDKKISKLVNEKTQEKLSSAYITPGLEPGESVYDPNVIPGADEPREIKEEPERNPEVSGAPQVSSAMSGNSAKDDRNSVESPSPGESQPPAIMALTSEEKSEEKPPEEKLTEEELTEEKLTEEKSSEEEAVQEKSFEEKKMAEQGGKSPASDSATDSSSSAQISADREEEIMDALNARLKRLPGDLSDYEKRVAIIEIKDDICEDFSITVSELDSILTYSKAIENSAQSE